MIGDFMIGLHAVSGLQRLNVRYSPHLHAHRPGANVSFHSEAGWKPLIYGLVYTQSTPAMNDGSNGDRAFIDAINDSVAVSEPFTDIVVI